MLHRELLRQGISAAGFARELRRHGIASVESVGAARLESNGKITVLTRQDLLRKELPPAHA